MRDMSEVVAYIALVRTIDVKNVPGRIKNVKNVE